MIEAYQELCEIVPKEIAVSPFFDKVIRFIIMVYDSRSGLVINERDINHRKNKAAKLIELDLLDEAVVQEIMTFSNTAVLEFTVKYLQRFSRSKEWAAICALEYKYWESIQKLMQPIQGIKDIEELQAVQKKATIADEIDKDIRRLESYYRIFFGDDEELSKKAQKRISPELIATLR